MKDHDGFRGWSHLKKFCWGDHFPRASVTRMQLYSGDGYINRTKNASRRKVGSMTVSRLILGNLVPLARSSTENGTMLQSGTAGWTRKFQFLKTRISNNMMGLVPKIPHISYVTGKCKLLSLRLGPGVSKPYIPIACVYSFQCDSVVKTFVFISCCLFSLSYSLTTHVPGFPKTCPSTSQHPAAMKKQ